MPEAHALVVDDASPDGTGELAEKLAARDPRVHVLRRAGKAGLGPAYLAGFSLGAGARLRRRRRDGRRRLARPGAAAPPAGGAGGRRPRAGLALRARRPRGGLAGCTGSSSPAWATGTPAGCCASRSATPPAATGPPGPTLIDRLPFDDVASQGYCFQVDWAWRAVRAGARVTEVPITFTERTLGRSKMSGSIVREALVRVTVWGLKDRLADRLPDLVRRPVPGRPRDGGRSSAAR